MKQLDIDEIMALQSFGLQDAEIIKMRLVREHKDEWKIRKYELCESNDRYFDSFSACTRRLHGVRMTEEELAGLCRECGVKTILPESEI